MASKRHRVGVDIGGTFTDLVLINDETGRRAVGKVLTTPEGKTPPRACSDAQARLRPDSEGPGHRRGGFRQEMEIGVRTDVPWLLSAMYDRTRCPARGIQGGSPGGAGAVGTADGRELRPKRQQRIEADERVVLSLPSGGGYGKPSERDPELVARSVGDGLVSEERARDIYCVVLKGVEVPKSVDPDGEATASPRAISHPWEPEE